jgi:hypothetical protein
VLGAVLVATGILAGCSVPGQASPPRPLVTIGQASVVPRTAGRALTPILGQLQVAFEQEDLGAISGLFTNVQLARTVRNTMQRWIEEGVSPLRVTLVYAHSAGKNRYIGTVEFWSDPRAIPTYMIFLFQRQKGGIRIIGTTDGVQGRTFDAATWTLTKSAHFLVYHSPYQLAGADAEVVANLEAQRSLFERKFRVKVASSIAYYLYPSRSMMADMSRGACGTTAEFVGCALPYGHPPLIHTIEWPSYHEPIHVYELALEPPIRKNGEVFLEPLFIAEGTAVALEDRQLDPRISDYCSDLTYIPLDSCAQQVESSTSPLSALSDRNFLHGDLGSEYLVAGSFVKYLILHYGYGRFGKFYYTLAAQPKDTFRDYDAAAHIVYHTGIRSLVSHWSAALCSSGC